MCRLGLKAEKKVIIDVTEISGKSEFYRCWFLFSSSERSHHVFWAACLWGQGHRQVFQSNSCCLELYASCQSRNVTSWAVMQPQVIASSLSLCPLCSMLKYVLNFAWDLATLVFYSTCLPPLSSAGRTLCVILASLNQLSGESEGNFQSVFTAGIFPRWKSPVCMWDSLQVKNFLYRLLTGKPGDRGAWHMRENDLLLIRRGNLDTSQHHNTCWVLPQSPGRSGSWVCYFMNFNWFSCKCKHLNNWTHLQFIRFVSVFKPSRLV